MENKENKEATAPFNFISLPKKIIKRYNSEEKLPLHNKFYQKQDGYYSGIIHYTICIVSPTMIGEGKEKATQQDPCQFFKDNEGNYTIPGSTIRGMVRTNLQIFGMCNPKDDIYDSRFMYRDWTSKDKTRKNHYKKEIDIKKEFFQPGKVVAGYICQDRKNHYVIYPVKDLSGKTFFSVPEQKVRSDLKDAQQINYMYRKELCNLDKKSYKDKYGQKKGTEEWQKKVKEYRIGESEPYYTKISFNTSKNSKIVELSVDRKLNFHGMILCSGYIPKKMAHYVIGEKDSSEREIELDLESIRAYQDDLVLTKKEGKKFYALPELGEEKPVFYAKGTERIYFGMTPYLRIIYPHSVYEGISFSSEEGIDYADALFGFTKEKTGKYNSYRSRVSFTDAVQEGNVREGKIVKAVLSSPSATCYPEYLDQPNKDSGKLISYADDFRIRGIKQYWLLDELEDGSSAKDKVITCFQPLDKGKFQGKIYYENLSKDELGLLLFSLKIEEKAFQNIGMAKPYGYGRVKIENLSIYAYCLEQLYSSFSLDTTSKEELNINELIQFYKDYVKQNYQINIDEQQNVKELIYMKTHIIEKEKVHYMTLKSFAEKRVLSYILEYDNQ